MLENDFNVFSACGSRTSIDVSLLVGRSLVADVNVVFAGDGDQLVMADSSPFAKIGSYLNRVLVSCPTFHLIAWTDHEHVRA